MQNATTSKLPLSNFIKAIKSADDYIETLLALNAKRRSVAKSPKPNKQALDLSGPIAQFQKISNSTPFFDMVIDKTEFNKTLGRDVQDDQEY